MKNKFRMYAPIISIVLSALAVGYTFASNVVVIPLGADETPSGMVSAYNSRECPAGWQLYEKAQARFIRGMYPSDTPGDQSGSNVHKHHWSQWDHTYSLFKTYDSIGNLYTMVEWTDGVGTEGSGSYPLAINNPTRTVDYYTRNETHIPLYVQFLYCKKV